MPTSSARRAKACAARTREWRLVDEVAKPKQFAANDAGTRARTRRDERPPGGRPRRGAHADRTHHRRRRLPYKHVDITIDRGERIATFTAKAPNGPRTAPRSTRSSLPARAGGRCVRPRTRRRDPVDAHQRARHRHLDLQDRRRRPQPARRRRHAAAHKDHWFVRETIGLLRRTLRVSTCRHARCSR